MAKTVPSNFDLPTELALNTGETIEAPDSQKIVEANHWLFAHYGTRVGGVIFEPPWETTSTSYTTTNDNPSRNLDRWAGAARLRRLTSGSNYRITVAIFGQEIDFRLRIYSWQSSSMNRELTLNPIQDSSNNNKDWATASGSIAESNITDNGTPDLLHMKADAKEDSSTNSPTKLYSFMVFAKVVGGSELP